MELRLRLLGWFSFRRSWFLGSDWYRDESLTLIFVGWSVVEGSVFGVVTDGYRRYGDTFAGWLETVFVRSVLDGADFAAVVDVAVFTKYFASGGFRFDFETSVGSFETVRVGAVFVVSVDLFQDWYRCNFGLSTGTGNSRRSRSGSRSLRDTSCTLERSLRW